MKRVLLSILFIGVSVLGSRAQQYPPGDLPDSVFSGKQGNFHVQGMAVDQANGFIYFSFTDQLIKTDLSGRLIGSVTGLAGHLGDLAFDPETGKIYGSLEFKDDAIGKGISTQLGLENSHNINFYIAIFDGSRIVKPHMKAAENELLQTTYLKEVVRDYEAAVKLGDKTVKHRFGCSGIDGVALAPPAGSPGHPKKYLYVAYGIYGDTSRNDNDYQVLLKYDVETLNYFSQKLDQKDPHHSGPAKPLAKYFVRTGNTNYGIQNLAYDSYSGNFFAAVYKGAKTQFPNYSLFVIDGHKRPAKARIVSDNRRIKVQTLPLLQAGLKDAGTGIRGWDFKWGSTGLFPLGEGFFYLSHQGTAGDGKQETTIHKYRWTGKENEAFVLVK